LLSVLPGSLLYVPESRRARFDDFGADVDASRVVSELGVLRFRKIVVDRFSIDLDEMKMLNSHGTTIGVDLGGPGRTLADYLIDTLPRLNDEPANAYSSAWLLSHDSADYVKHHDVSPPEVNHQPRGEGSILISFGGEDPARLTEKAVHALQRIGVDMKSVRVVRPKLRELEEESSQLPTVIDPVETLEPLLAESEWVITAFGLTAFEAARLRCHVITIAPTPYHQKLSAKAGFFSAGVAKVASRRLAWALSHPEEVEARRPVLSGAQEGSLEETIVGLVPPVRRGCPVHGFFGRTIFRNEEKSYFTCPACGIVYLERFRADEEEYNSAYFMEEYRAQYGRTYLEDFPAIHGMGVERVRRILRLSPPGRALLDVGCAYGPFLAAAAKLGFEAHGLDVAEAPVRYVREQLGFHAVEGSILSERVRAELPLSSYDVVSLWFVVEHFSELDALLSTLAGLVVRGGILAMSTPHGRGVSARRNSSDFFSGSPRDHYTIWTTASAKRLLREFGFRLESVRVTGHHPERYPAAKASILPRWLAKLHSRVFGWGDTFELYARRVE